MAQASSNLKVMMFWGDILYDTAIFRANESITIGRGVENNFVLDPKLHNTTFNNSFKLIHVLPGYNAEIFFSDEYHGHIKFGDSTISLHAAIENKKAIRVPDGHYRAQLTRKDHADIVIGHVSFSLEWVEDAVLIPRTSIVNKKNWWMALLLIFSTVGIVSLISLIKPVEPEKPPERLITLDPLPKEKTKATSDTPSPQAPSKAAIGEVKTRDGGAQKGELGKATVKPSKENAAIQNLRKSNLGSLVSGLTSAGANTPSKNPTANAVAGAMEQVGTGGFSTEGLKTGGGGKSVGIGRTVGQGEGGFAGTGRLGLAGSSSIDGAGAGGGGGKARVAGGLDRDVIESYIRRRLDRIRLCYERQLNFFPKLSGKVSVRFVIGKTGQVVSSNLSEDTMKNESVKTCILAEVKSWNFPPPEGGTQVNVDYPFVFESSAKSQ